MELLDRPVSLEMERLPSRVCNPRPVPIHNVPDESACTVLTLSASKPCAVVKVRILASAMRVKPCAEPIQRLPSRSSTNDDIALLPRPAACNPKSNCSLWKRPMPLSRVPIQSVPCRPSYTALGLFDPNPSLSDYERNFPDR